MPTDNELGEWPVGDDPSCCRDHVLAWREMKAALQTIQGEAQELVDSIKAVWADHSPPDGYYAPESHQPERTGAPFTTPERRTGKERRVAGRASQAPYRRSGRDRRKGEV